MKEITIIVISDSKNNILKIYENNCKIKDICINNKYLFCGKINNLYKICIISNNNIYISSFYINNYNKKYVFDVRKKNHYIFINLIDKNYPCLKIKKGVIKLGKTI